MTENKTERDHDLVREAKTIAGPENGDKGRPTNVGYSIE